jgi:hypothetical protein
MSASNCTSNKPYFPLAGGATDGFSNENNASATCFCGAVQLQFVSRHLLSSSFDLRPGRRDPSLVLTLIAWPRPSGPARTRLRRQLPLQLHRLPQAYCRDFGRQLCHPLRPTAPDPPPGRSQPEPVRHRIDDQVGPRDGQLLLQDVRDAHVPQGRQHPRSKHPPARDGRRL